MARRFDAGPIIVSAGALLLLASLFLDWYGPVDAWDAFELADVLLAVLALAALVVAAGLLAPELAYVDRRWLPAVAVAATVIVIAELVSPPAFIDADRETGVWLAFAAALVMLLGTALSLGRISLAVAVEGRDLRRRVAAVDNRQETTETAAVVAAAAPDDDEAAPRTP